MLILYADILFLINFSMDFLGLFVCSRVMRCKINRGRILISSFVGALYGVASMVFDIDFALNCMICVTVALIMIFISFRENRLLRLIVLTMMYLFVSATLGGLMSISYDLFNRVIANVSIENSQVTYNGARMFVIIGMTSVVSLIFSRILIRNKNVEYVELSVKTLKNNYTLKGLCDSGNLLVEPFSGKSVILISEESLLGKEILSFHGYKVKYIPFRDVNGEGVLRGITSLEIKINGKNTEAIIATCKNNSFCGYDALVPKNII